MKKLLFGITSLGLGGAEKSLVSLVNRLVDVYDITIFTLYPDGDLSSTLNSKIKQISLFNKPFENRNDLSKMKIRAEFSSDYFLKKWAKQIEKEEYDHVIAYLEGPITNLFAQLNVKIDKIAWVHTDLSKHIHSKLRLKQAKAAYPKYRHVVCVSENCLKDFEAFVETPIKTSVIGNLIDSQAILNASLEPIDLKWSDDFNLLVVARLYEPKGVERLVKIHHQMLAKGLMHQFYVIGEGPERAKIEQVIKDYHVNDTFHLLGKKDNPYPYMKHADAIVSPSYYEGYGLVYLESMLLNRPIVATKTGGSSLLNDYPYALVVKNDEIHLRKGLEQIIKQPFKIEKPYIFLKNDQILIQFKELLNANA